MDDREMAERKRLTTMTAISGLLQDHMSQNPKIRTISFYVKKTGISKSQMHRVLNKESLLAEHAAFTLLEFISEDAMTAYQRLRELPCYHKYASAMISLIEQKGGNIANSEDDCISYLTKSKYVDLISFLTIPRTMELVESRKGSDSIKLVEKLIAAKVVEKKGEYLETGNFHVPNRTNVTPQIMKGHIDHIIGSPTPHPEQKVFCDIRSLTPENRDKLKNIITTAIKDASEVPTENSGNTGAMIGLYFSPTEE